MQCRISGIYLSSMNVSIEYQNARILLQSVVTIIFFFFFARRPGRDGVGFVVMYSVSKL